MGSLRDFYLGVVDFLAVLLPGTLVLGAALSFGIQVEPVAAAVARQPEPAKIAAFLAVSFAVGQLCNAVGSAVLDHLYDVLYAPDSGWISTHETYLESWRKSWKQIRAEQLAKAQGYDGSWWAALGLRLLLAGVAARPKIWDSGTAARRVALEKELTTIAKGRKIRGVYQGVRAYLKLSKPEAFTELEKLEGDQKFFRSITIGSLLIAQALWLKDRAVLWHYIWPCWLLAALALVRYISLRRKAVERAYLYFALRDVPKGIDPPAK